MSTYLIINISAVAIPILLSFDRRVGFYKLWKYVIPSITITAILFIFWDIAFTRLNVWSFNPVHVGSVKIFGLPLEEIMFFFTVPYASIFIYEVLKVYVKHDYLKNILNFIVPSIVLALIVTAFIYHNRLYTFYSCTSLSVVFILLQYVLRVSFLGRFFMAYGVIIIPFLLVNGILTGSFIDEPVVLYNDQENMGIRIFTIPFEDVIYGMLLILLNVSIIELLRSRQDKVLS
jgi:lycopene cyclase domain-containing protein